MGQMTPHEIEAARLVKEWMDEFTYKLNFSQAAEQLLIDKVTAALAQVAQEQRERDAEIADERAAITDDPTDARIIAQAIRQSGTEGKTG